MISAFPTKCPNSIHLKDRRGNGIPGKEGMEGQHGKEEKQMSIIILKLPGSKTYLTG